jgi:glucose/arabinose dehydrogenase
MADSRIFSRGFPVSIIPGLLIAMALGAFSAAPAGAQVQRSSAGVNFEIIELAQGLNRPWALALIPSAEGGVPESAFVTERPGRLLYISGLADPGGGSVSRRGVPTISSVSGLPRLSVRGQGGLLDVILHPDFLGNSRLYFSAAVPGSFGAAGTGVYTARFDRGGMRVTDVELLFEMERKTASTVHFGSRLAIGGDGALYVSTGDRGSPERAQEPGDSAGSIMRIPLDAGGRGAGTAALYSFGHRNIQGLTFDPASGALMAHEHGPRGGDEINLIVEGANYGWPLVSYGVNYNGSAVSEFQRLPGIAEPLVYWVPSIAPSGFARYPAIGVFAPAEGEGWSGNLFVGALAGTQLRRVDLPGEALAELPDRPLNGTAEEEALLSGVLGRIRDVRIDGRGYVYLLTDADAGALYRLEPVP